MASPFKRSEAIDEIDAIFLTDEDVGAQMEAEDPDLKAFKERQRASPCYKKVVRSRRDHSAAGRVMSLVDKFKKSGDFVEQKEPESDSDDDLPPLMEIKRKMMAASPKKSVQKPLSEAIKSPSKVACAKTEPSTPVKEVEKPAAAVPEKTKEKVDQPLKTDSESVEEPSDKENKSAAANKKPALETKKAPESPAKQKPISPTKPSASATTDKKQPTLLSFFKQPASTSPLKRKREEDGLSEEMQGKTKQLKTHA